MNNDYLPKELGNESTTISSKKDTKKIECDGMWRKSCPNCQRDIFYSSSDNLKRSIRKNSWCKECRPGRNKWAPIYTEKDYTRKCPTCGESLTYKNLYDKNRANKKNLQCVKCVQLGHPFHGKIENFPRGDSHHRKGKSYYPPKAITKRHVAYNKKACKYLDDLSKERGWNLIHAENGGEKHCLGYHLDAFDSIRNIVVEYDEKHHYTYDGKLKQKDIIRMNEIIQTLNCEFYRYDEKRDILTRYN